MATTTIIDDPWDLLGVSRGTPLEDIRQQRNALALASHPDRCPDPALKETWTARMATINQAFTLATDAEEWVKYKKHHQIEDEEDFRTWQHQQQHSSQARQVSERVARARQHKGAEGSTTTTTATTANTNATAKSARAQRRRNLHARADDVEEAFADGACTAEARTRWAGYFSRQEANNSEVLETRVAARVERDAEEVRETRRFAAQAAIGSYEDAAALLTENGGAWTAEELVEESLGALEMDEGSDKQRKAARRRLIGEAVDRRRRLQVEWGRGHEHGFATLGSGPSQLRIERGASEGSEDAEMDALEQERREGLQKLEQYAETKKFRAEWVGTLGNDAPVKTTSRPPNRKESRQMNKEMKKLEKGKA